MGIEDKVHALSQIHPEQYHLFEKFVGLISKNPQFFDNATHLFHWAFILINAMVFLICNDLIKTFILANQIIL